MRLLTGEYAYEVDIEPVKPLPANGERWAAKVLTIKKHSDGKNVAFKTVASHGLTPGTALDKAFEAAMKEIGDRNEE